MNSHCSLNAQKLEKELVKFKVQNHERKTSPSLYERL